jgi:cleavage stimulation factor subunit 2
MNNYDFNGRPLRVDFADNEKAQMQQVVAASNAARTGSQGARPTSLPQAPMNSPSTPETVNSMLEGMSASQLYDIVAKMKGMIQANPEQAKQILMSNPPLTYALLQAEALLGMVNVQVIQKLLSSKPNIPVPMIQPGVTPALQPIPATPSSGLLPTPPVPVQSTTPTQQSFNAPQPIKTPQQMYSVPPTQGPPAPQPFPFSAQFDILPDQQKALLQQVVNLTPEQIEKLPHEQRLQVQQLRQTIASNFRSY